MPRASRQHALAALAAVIALAHVASFYDPEQSIVTDIRYFLYFAWRIADGAVPHLDLFDNKTFLASFAGALFYRVGAGLGADPLVAIRVGNLGLAATCAWLAFVVFRRLGAGSAVAGFLGLFASLGFGLLAALPAVGNVPKLLMSIGAALVALCVHDRRWFLAGIAGGLAFLDWQIGALAGAAALATALFEARGRRLRAVLGLAAGAGAAVAPFAIYYAAHGALLITLQQTVLASFFRASASLARVGFFDRLEKIAGLVARGCPEQQWLFVAGLAGLAIAPVWLWTRRSSETWRLLLPLVLYHAGIVAFSLVDFQGYGDFFLLLHSVAFFLGLLWLAVYERIRDGTRALGLDPRRRNVLAGAALFLAVVAARPGPLRPELRVAMPDAPAGVTLTDQKQVAAAMKRRAAGRRLVLLSHSELLFLMPHVNPTPLVYWNPAAYSAFGDPETETFSEAAVRVLFSLEPDAFVYPRKTPFPASIARDYEVDLLRSKSGALGVPLYTRKQAP